MLDYIKALATIYKESNKIEEYTKIMELHDRVKKMQQESDALREENRKLKNEIREKAEFKNGAYWLNGKGPFCPRCLEKDCELITIFKSDPVDIFAKCPVCEKDFNITGRSSHEETLRAMEDYKNSI